MCIGVADPATCLSWVAAKYFTLTITYTIIMHNGWTGGMAVCRLALLPLGNKVLGLIPGPGTFLGGW